jgi:hypothetical protein
MTTTETDPQQALFEVTEVARLLREAPTDRAVCGVVAAVLKRAGKLKLYGGHPLEPELRQAWGDLCFAYADWWRGPGALLFGPDVAGEKAKFWEQAGHVMTLTAGEVEPYCLTRSVKHELQ